MRWDAMRRPSHQADFGAADRFALPAWKLDPWRDQLKELHRHGRLKCASADMWLADWQDEELVLTVSQADRSCLGVLVNVLGALQLTRPS